MKQNGTQNLFFGLAAALLLFVVLPGPLASAEEAAMSSGAAGPVPFTYFQGEPLRIGNQVQLLADDFIIEDRWMLTRRVGQVLKHLGNPILVRDKPWEDALGGYPCVLYDPDIKKYRMWYECFNLTNYFAKQGPSYYVCYAESDDGFHWTKPELEGFPFGSYERTNVVYTGATGKRASGKQVFINPDTSDPQKKFVMVYIDGRVRMAYSPDGLHWNGVEAPLFAYHSDFPNHLVWNPERQLWHLYLRPAVNIQGGEGPLPEGLRHTGRRLAMSTSKDLLDWSTPRTVMYPDEADQPDYDNAVVFRRHGVFLAMYSQMFAETGKSETETYFAMSRDGVNWTRTWDRAPLIPRGPEGSFDHGQVEAGSGAPLELGSDLLIYYYASPAGQSEWNAETAIGVGRLRKDRFVGQSAGDQTGYLITREFILEGTRLLINCSAVYKPYHDKESGIQVEVVEAPDFSSLETRHGKRIPGYTLDDCKKIMTDNPAHEVTWKEKNNVQELTGKAVYLRFQMKNATLFSFQIAP